MLGEPKEVQLEEEELKPEDQEDFEQGHPRLEYPGFGLGLIGIIVIIMLAIIIIIAAFGGFNN